MTAAGAKFSEAIISRVDCWRWSWASTAAATSGSSSCRGAFRSDVSAMRYDSSAGRKGGVLVGGEQVVGLLGDAYLEQPAALERGGVDQRRVVDHVLVGLGDLTADRGVQVAHGLGRLQLPAGLARGDGGAHV